MFFFIRGVENLKKFKGGGKLFCAKMPANDSFMPLGAWWMVWVVGGAGRGLHRLHGFGCRPFGAGIVDYDFRVSKSK